MIRTAVYLPLIFYTYECAVRSEKKRWVIFGGFAVGMQILAGHPQIAYYSILFLGIYALCRFAADSTGKKTRDLIKYVIPMFGMTFTGMTTAAVSLFPLFEMSLSSLRFGGDYEYASNGSLNPLRLIHLFFPDISLLWPGVVKLPVNLELNPYVGILPLFLIMFSIASARRKQTILIGFLALLALLLAFGSYTPLFKTMFSIIPGMRFFRLHSRVLLVFMFSSATLAGMGAGALMEMSEHGSLSKRKIIPLVWSFLLLAIILILFLNFEILFKLIYRQMKLLDGTLVLPLILMSVTTVLIWTIYLKRAPLQGLNICLVIMVACDLILTGWKHITILNVSDRYRMPSFVAGKLENLPLGHYRVYLHESALPANHGMFYHIENLNGFCPIFLERTARFMEEMTGVRPFRDPDDYMISTKCFMNGLPFPFKILNVRYSMIFEADLRKPMLIENKDPFPRVIWVHHAEVIAAPEEIMMRLRSDDFDPRLIVLLEQAPSRPLAMRTTNVPSASVQITDYQINSINVVFNASSDGWLLFSEQFYPGWKAWCDEKSVPIYRANYILRAIPVPAGKHKVVMKYCPLSFKAGAAMSLISLLTFLGMILKSTSKALPSVLH